MGLFRTKTLLNDDHFAKLVEMAQAADGAIRGSLDGTRLVYTDSALALADAEQRARLTSQLRPLFALTEEAPDMGSRAAAMRDQEALLNRAPRDEHYAPKAVAYVAWCGLLKVDFVCAAAMQFPKDRRLQELANTLWAYQAEVFMRFWGDSVVVDLMESLPNLKQWFERRTGLDRW